MKYFVVVVVFVFSGLFALGQNWEEITEGTSIIPFGTQLAGDFVVNFEGNSYEYTEGDQPYVFKVQRYSLLTKQWEYFCDSIPHRFRDDFNGLIYGINSVEVKNDTIYVIHKNLWMRSIDFGETWEYSERLLDGLYERSQGQMHYGEQMISTESIWEGPYETGQHMFIWGDTNSSPITLAGYPKYRTVKNLLGIDDTVVFCRSDNYRIMRFSKSGLNKFKIIHAFTEDPKELELLKNHMIVRLDHSLQVSDDAGENWISYVPSFLSAASSSFNYTFSDNDTLFYRYDNLYMSTDYGADWSIVDLSPLVSPHIYEIRDGLILAGAGSKIYLTNLNDIITSVPEYETASSFIFPNPANSNITIQAGETIEKVELFDNTGVYLEQLTAVGLNKFGLPQTADGLYFIRYNTRAGSHFLKVFVSQ